MALEYKILEHKKVITHNDESLIDLLSESFSSSNIRPNGTFVGVNKMYIGRPDLISLAVYGTDEYADIICKLNGISNPFELNENDILFMPDYDFIMSCVQEANSTDIISDTNETLNTFIDNKAKYQKNKSDIRSPHMQLKGDKNYVIDRSSGLVFY